MYDRWFVLLHRSFHLVRRPDAQYPEKNTRSHQYAIIKITSLAGCHPVEQGKSDTKRVKKREPGMAEAETEFKTRTQQEDQQDRGQFNHQFHIQEKYQKDKQGPINRICSVSEFGNDFFYTHPESCLNVKDQLNWQYLVIGEFQV